MKHLLAPAVVLAAALLLPTGMAAARDLNVVASFSVLADVVREVGGQHARVTALIGPNGNPHVYQPTPRDAAALNASDCVFLSGLGLEGWIERMVSASGYKGTPVIVSDGIATITRERRGRTGIDPHVWNNPLNVIVWVENIRAALSAIDPDDATDYAANAARYAEALRALDREAHASIDAIAPEKRAILTSHDALGYFASEYGVRFMAPQGLSTESEAAAQDIARIVQQIRTSGVKAFFIESAADPRTVQAIAAETGAQPGGVLFVESLSDTAGPAPTYAKMFRHNLELLVAAMKR